MVINAHAKIIRDDHVDVLVGHDFIKVLLLEDGDDLLACTLACKVIGWSFEHDCFG